MDNIGFREFTAELTTVIELKQKPRPSNAVLALWFKMLKPFSTQHCLAALDKHTASSPYLPTPDGLIATILANDGRPTSEEAWATALAASDESATVVWTDEIAQALSMGASDLLADGDKTAARMAFRDSYNRLIDQARSDCRPVNTRVSLGHDVASRNSVIEQARAKGLLSDEKASSLLLEETTAKGNEFKRLAGSAIASKSSGDTIANLKKMRASLL